MDVAVVHAGNPASSGLLPGRAWLLISEPGPPVLRPTLAACRAAAGRAYRRLPAQPAPAHAPADYGAHGARSHDHSRPLPRTQVPGRSARQEHHLATIVAASAIRWSLVQGGPSVARGPWSTSPARAPRILAACASTAFASKR